MTGRSYRWLLLGLAAFALTTDLGSKYYSFRELYHRGEHDLVPGWFKFIAQYDSSAPVSDGALRALQTWSTGGDEVMPRVNHGALFGMGGAGRGFANGFFAVVSLAAAVAILTWGLRGQPSRERWLSIALGLILGGTLGNFYDRVVFGGVRDFMYFYRIEWPVFNFADCCLVVGAGLLLVQAVFAPPPASPAEAPTA
ncbi:signal peptidase II [Urbifossiella limnaea]|uniref:Lipoprotein signal peptidase n=1 Tax=Urbifossiella limnaea TaxID=2528023 RepID=A0A517Y2L1_9BACT|nr:signal peptidase II [Urbifossiella limnaea]QDU23938.1 Lipoprotein signal peptidase [Urbifossiella limnaea]